MTTMGDDPLLAALTEQLQAMRAAERDIFGSLDPEVRDRPMRPGDWSPKDHQGHLTAWKKIQSERIQAAARGEQLADDARETDERNAELQALRADWSWEEIVREADEVGERLVADIRAAGSELLTSREGMVGQIYGNSASHATTHFIWLSDAGIGVDTERITAFLEDHERQLMHAPLADYDRAVGLYNVACAHALAGRLERARPLLRAAFGIRPDLAEYAKQDPDLVDLRDELEALTAAS
jgi:hypothetical protein